MEWIFTHGHEIWENVNWNDRSNINIYEKEAKKIENQIIGFTRIVTQIMNAFMNFISFQNSSNT